VSPRGDNFEMSSPPVPSPCINVCRMNPASGLCEGCWRTLDEIAAWSRLDEDEKRAVWTLIDTRRAASVPSKEPR